jgi:hypothetical protein
VVSGLPFAVDGWPFAVRGRAKNSACPRHCFSLRIFRAGFEPLGRQAVNDARDNPSSHKPLRRTLSTYWPNPRAERLKTGADLPRDKRRPERAEFFALPTEMELSSHFRELRSHFQAGAGGFKKTQPIHKYFIIRYLGYINRSGTVVA